MPMNLFCVPVSVPGFRKQPTARKFSELGKFYSVNWGHVLGQGGFSTVYKGEHLSSNTPVAVKKIPRNSNSNNKLLKQEINASMKVKNHEFIVSLFDVFVASDVVILCLEYMTGDVLFKRIVRTGPLSEEDTRRHFFGISSAVAHLHANKIVHRDIKPENLMFSKNKASQEILKLTDFGLSKILPENANTMQTFCGTPAYLAPEAWAVGTKELDNHNVYSRKVDSWSLGVTMFVSVSGYHPFDPEGKADLKELRERIMQVKWGLDDPGWNGVSENLKTLLRNTICRDDVRWAIDQILASQFFRANITVGNVDANNRNKKRVLTSAMEKLSISENKRTVQTGKKAKVDVFKQQVDKDDTLQSDSSGSEETISTPTSESKPVVVS